MRTAGPEGRHPPPLRERLPEGGSCAQWQAGRVKQAQFCWWGAWAPWVLWAEEGPARAPAPGPRRCWLPGLGRFWMFGGMGSGPALDRGLQLPGTWGRQTSSLRSSLASGRPGQGAAGPVEPRSSRGPGPGRSSLLCPDGPQLGAPRPSGDLLNSRYVLIPKFRQLPSGTQTRLVPRLWRAGEALGWVKSLLPLLIGSEAGV